MRRVEMRYFQMARGRLQYLGNYIVDVADIFLFAFATELMPGKALALATVCLKFHSNLNVKDSCVATKN